MNFFYPWCICMCFLCEVFVGYDLYLYVIHWILSILRYMNTEDFNGWYQTLKPHPKSGVLEISYSLGVYLNEKKENKHSLGKTYFYRYLIKFDTGLILQTHTDSILLHFHTFFFSTNSTLPIFKDKISTIWQSEVENTCD